MRQFRRIWMQGGTAIFLTTAMSATSWAVNPAQWQIAEQVNRIDSTKTWTSPTAIDLGRMLWRYDFEITKVTGTVNVPFIGDITQDITDSLDPAIRMGSGQTTNLPAVLLDDAIADPSTGTTADLFVEITSAGFGRAVFSNISLGSVAVPIFGTRPIQRVNVEATINVIGYNFGDYDLNGVINASDYAVWKQAFGGASATGFADGNRDGVVNAADYTVWRDAFAGSGGGGAAAGVVPEPAACWLALAALTTFLGLRRA
jgi:hypothetical protein